MQELGETRSAMARGLMNKIEKIMNEVKKDNYFILIHAKPYPYLPQTIKQKILIMDRKPSMMLSCMLFEVDNREGKLLLHWALPGDWPVWSVGGTNEPVPETIASYDRLEKRLKLGKGSEFFELQESTS